MNVNVGFIGLGIMGKPMALNLIRGGYPLRVYGHRVESMEPLTAAGAQACASPAEVARAADMTFIDTQGRPSYIQLIEASSYQTYNPGTLWRKPGGGSSRYWTTEGGGSWRRFRRKTRSSRR